MSKRTGTVLVILVSMLSLALPLVAWKSFWMGYYTGKQIWSHMVSPAEPYARPHSL